MKRILVIEDDEMLNAGLCYNLQMEGFEAAPAFGAKTAKKLWKEKSFDLILLDGNLPDGDGFAVSREIRKESKVPIVFLTARDMDEDMIEGFENGADDYITKPFNIKIVIQRIKAILRRCEGDDTVEKVSQCGNLAVDFESHTVKKHGKLLTLTPTEFKLLHRFCLNPGQVLTRQILLEKLWDQDGNFVDEHTLTINISRLRAKIADEEYAYIKTIYGGGYKWIGESHE